MEFSEETKNFIESPWCTSGNNCDTCRKPGAIRDNIRAKWPELDCEKWREKIAETPQAFSTLDLHLSDRCNFGCSFCYAKNCAGIASNVALQKQALDWFVGQAKASTITVNFYGGEPLLEFETIKDLVAYAAKFQKKFRWCVVTNLSLLDSDKLAWLNANGVKISPSIDGCKAAQDCHRVFKGGQSSAEIVYTAAALMNKNRKGGHVRATISPKSAPYLLESIQHLASLGFREITAVPASGVDWTDENLSTLSDQTHKLTDWWIAEMRHGRKYTLYHINHVLRAVAPNRRNDRLCGAGRSMVAVDTAGNLWPCHRFCNQDSPEEWRLGSIAEGGITNHELLERIRALRITGQETPDCSACPAKVACHAFCLHDMIVHGKFPATCTAPLPAMPHLCMIWPMYHAETMRAHDILTAEKNRTYAGYVNGFKQVKKNQMQKQKQKPVNKKILPCIHGQILEESYAKCRPCKGRKVLCQKSENPVKEWYEKGCNPSMCKFYQVKGEPREALAIDIL
jgi:uncharacterized protein